MSRGDDQTRPDWLTEPDNDGWMSCVKCDATYYADELLDHCTGCRKIRRDFVKAAMQGMLANPDSLTAVGVMAKEQNRDPGEVHAKLVCDYADDQLTELGLRTASTRPAG